MRINTASITSQLRIDRRVDKYRARFIIVACREKPNAVRLHRPVVESGSVKKPMDRKQGLRELNWCLSRAPISITVRGADCQRNFFQTTDYHSCVSCLPDLA
jgi:hypothetical protein